jgi:hypothetical protein
VQRITRVRALFSSARIRTTRQFPHVYSFVGLAASSTGGALAMGASRQSRMPVYFAGHWIRLVTSRQTFVRRRHWEQTKAPPPGQNFAPYCFTRGFRRLTSDPQRGAFLWRCRLAGGLSAAGLSLTFGGASCAEAEHDLAPSRPVFFSSSCLQVSRRSWPSSTSASRNSGGNRRLSSRVARPWAIRHHRRRRMGHRDSVGFARASRTVRRRSKRAACVIISEFSEECAKGRDRSGNRSEVG